jgi:hypothetical protein
MKDQRKISKQAGQGAASAGDTKTTATAVCLAYTLQRESRFVAMQKAQSRNENR